ncbi:MAG: tyrosine-type recombinase/integrase [Terracidiphilus sp.]
MELSAGGVRRQKALLFSVAAKNWLAESAHWSDSTREIYETKLTHLKPAFGRMLLSDIAASDISKFQRARQKTGASGREINMETAVLRMILRKHRLWYLVEPDYRPLREREEVGRALSPEESQRLLVAAKNTRSRSLYPALVLLLNTGMRVTELRMLHWRQVDLLARNVTVGRSKTLGGEGRMIPLNQYAFDALVDWRSQFKKPSPDHFVFPTERYGLDGDEGVKNGAVAVWNLDPQKPIGSWKVAWTACRKAAKVNCRLHDLRHTFVSRLGEGQVADSTLTALSGWMSRKMLERYSHARTEAKRHAVELLTEGKIERDSPQNHPQRDFRKNQNVM